MKSNIKINVVYGTERPVVEEKCENEKYTLTDAVKDIKYKAVNKWNQPLKS